MRIEDLRPEDLHGPDEQQAVVDYLNGCGFHVLDRNWQAPDGSLEIAAVERNIFVVVDIRRPHQRWHRPLHDISHVRRRQLRVLAAAWLTAHGKRFDEIRIDAIALTWDRGNGYIIEHVRGVDVENHQGASEHRGELADGCITNYSVWPLNSDGEEIASISQFYAASAADAIRQAECMPLASQPDVVGWRVIRHEPEQP